MNRIGLKIGDRVLVQTRPNEREHAKVKAFMDGQQVLIQRCDGSFIEIDSEFVIKRFD